MSTARRGLLADMLTPGVIAGTAALTAALYPRLPDPMPTHFDLMGRPNGWMPRPFGAHALLGVTIVVVGLVRFAGVLLPAGWRDRFEASPIRTMALGLAAFLCGAQVLILRAALSPSPRLGTGIWMLLGALWVVLGLALPRTRRNPFFGVRTSFALASDENWARTQRAAGYWMTGGGVVVLIAGLLGWRAAAMGALVVSAFAPVLWSWLLARRGPGDIPRLSDGQPKRPA
jgi:uncharacterized membrane protein